MVLEVNFERRIKAFKLRKIERLGFKLLIREAKICFEQLKSGL